MNALAKRFLLKELTALFKGLASKVPLHTHQLRTSHATDLIVKSKFSDSSGADDEATRLSRQSLRKRKDLGQRWLDLTDSNSCGAGILALYPVSDNRIPYRIVR
jgi:hypothetical protein